MKRELMFERTEFDFVRTITSGQVFSWRKLPDGSWLGVDGRNWYQVELEEGPAVRLAYRSNEREGSFASLFQLNKSCAAIGEHIAEREPALADIVSRTAGLRLMRPSNPVEVFFSFLCSSNNNLARITSMVQYLYSLGDPLWEAPGGPRRFPSLQRLASLDEHQLRRNGFGYRAKSIPEAARFLIDKPREWWDMLRECPLEEAQNELKACFGIGPKLADCILLYGFHRDDAVPVDTHLWQAVIETLRPDWAGQSLSEERYSEITKLFADAFGPDAGWAQLLLYHDHLAKKKTSVSVH